MTSKERVRTVLEGGIPDRVPLGEFAIDFDTVERIVGHETYFRAKAKSRIAFWEGRHDEVAQSYLEDHIDLHKKLDLDIVTFSMATWHIPRPTDAPPPRKIDDNTWEDTHGRVYKYSQTTADITCVRDPVLEAETYAPEDYVPAITAATDAELDYFKSILDSHDVAFHVGSPEDLEEPPDDDALTLYVPEDHLDEAQALISDREGAEEDYCLGGDDDDDDEDDDDDFGGGGGGDDPDDF